MEIRYCTNCGQACSPIKQYVFECPQKHINYINPIPGSTAFIVRGNEILYARRAIEPFKGGLNIVGGIIDPNETAEECAVRECKEEFGVDVEIVEYLGSYAGLYGERPTINSVFIAKWLSGEPKADDDQEKGSEHWRHVDNLPDQSELAWKWVAEPQEKLKLWLASGKSAAL